MIDHMMIDQMIDLMIDLKQIGLKKIDHMRMIGLKQIDLEKIDHMKIGPKQIDLERRKIHMKIDLKQIDLERKNNSSKRQYCKTVSPKCHCSSYLLAAASRHEFGFDSLGRKVESTPASLPIDHTGIQSHHCRMPECCMAEGRQCCHTLVHSDCIVSSPCEHVIADQNRMISSTSPRPSTHHTRNLGNSGVMMMMMMDTRQYCKVEFLEGQRNRLNCLKSHLEYEFGYHHHKIVSTGPSLANHHIHTLLGLMMSNNRSSRRRHFRFHFHSQSYQCHLQIA